MTVLALSCWHSTFRVQSWLSNSLMTSRTSISASLFLFVVPFTRLAFSLTSQKHLCPGKFQGASCSKMKTSQYNAWPPIFCPICKDLAFLRDTHLQVSVTFSASTMELEEAACKMDQSLQGCVAKCPGLITSSLSLRRIFFRKKHLYL